MVTEWNHAFEHPEDGSIVTEEVGTQRHQLLSFLLSAEDVLNVLVPPWLPWQTYVIHLLNEKPTLRAKKTDSFRI